MESSLPGYTDGLMTRSHIWWSGCFPFLLFSSVSYQAHTFLCSLVGLEAEPTETLWEMLLGPRSITPFLPQWAGTIRSSTISCPQNLSQSLDLRVLLSRLDFRQEVNPPWVSTPFAPALSVYETTEEPYAVCWYTTSVQFKGAVSQPRGGWILGSCSQGRKIPLNMDVCVSECVFRYVVFVGGGREKNIHPVSSQSPILPTP